MIDAVKTLFYFTNSGAKMDEITYKPCKHCESTEYDNSEQIAYDHDENGLLIIEPDRCDLCDFELMLSPSNLLH